MPAFLSTAMPSQLKPRWCTSGTCASADRVTRISSIPRKKIRSRRAVVMSAASTPDSVESDADASESWELPHVYASTEAQTGCLELNKWRDFRAQLVAAEQSGFQRDIHASDARDDYGNGNQEAIASVWAHSLSRLEVGACLVASREHVWPASADYLQNAVILITDIDSSSGIQGLILNRPTGRKVSDSPGVLARVGAVFRENMVHLGGDCCMGYLDVLHARPDISGSREVIPGIYRGGFNSCKEFVLNGAASSNEFNMIISYTRWTWSQFLEEMDLSAWHIAAVSTKLILHPFSETSRHDPTSLWRLIMHELSL